jgi:hypothetical protein
MKNMNKYTLLTALLLLGTTSYVHSQNYTIDWFTVDGGGGSTAGGSYALSGTAGQPDAGHSIGGNFYLDSGFWSIIDAVQPINTPSLRIVLTRTNTIVIAWPAPSTSFSLQQNNFLGTSNWLPVSDPVNVVGSENQVIILNSGGSRFYRLTSP